MSDLRLRPYRGSSQASHCGATASNLADTETTRAPSGVGQLSVPLESWRLHLEAANLSPRMVRGYTDDCALFAAFLIDKGMPTAVASIKREHVEAFIAAELARTSPSSAATRYRSLQQFFRWLDEAGVIDSSPMAKMRKPIIPEQPVPVLPDADVKRLLDSCAGRDFRNRRDAAIIRLFLDTRMRLEGMAGLRYDASDADMSDVDLRGNVVRVTVQGRTMDGGVASPGWRLGRGSGWGSPAPAGRRRGRGRDGLRSHEVRFAVVIAGPPLFGEEEDPRTPTCSNSPGALTPSGALRCAGWP